MAQYTIMVYAPYGRAGITMMQDYCRLLGIGVGDEDLRDLGQTVQALPVDHPIAGVVKRAKDFARPDALADALLNPQDRAYSVPQIYDWLERCGLKFGRWYEQAAYLPQCGAIEDAPHGARLSALPPPAQHAAVELLRGTMDRHSFVAYRDDREREAQPITFEGDAWRSFVPVRLPWTLTVKDRAPRGVAAVLINPSHTYPDLALFIDAAQERLLTAIDGERSVGEILDSAGETDQRRARAASFSSGSGSTTSSCSTRNGPRRGKPRIRRRATRTTQRKPTWLVDVSIGSACRAAGR